MRNSLTDPGGGHGVMTPTKTSDKTWFDPLRTMDRFNILHMSLQDKTNFFRQSGPPKKYFRPSLNDLAPLKYFARSDFEVDTTFPTKFVHLEIKII